MKQNSIPDSKKDCNRRIYINCPPEHHFPNYITNMVETTKYNILTFLPKNIYEQFTRVWANFYFLFLIILQSFSIFETVNIAVVASPLAVVLGLNATKVILS